MIIELANPVWLTLLLVGMVCFFVSVLPKQEQDLKKHLGYLLSFGLFLILTWRFFMLKGQYAPEIWNVGSFLGAKHMHAIGFAKQNEFFLIPLIFASILSGFNPFLFLITLSLALLGLLSHFIEWVWILNCLTLWLWCLSVGAFGGDERRKGALQTAVLFSLIDGFGLMSYLCINQGWTYPVLIFLFLLPGLFRLCVCLWPMNRLVFQTTPFRVSWAYLLVICPLALWYCTLAIQWLKSPLPSFVIWAGNTLLCLHFLLSLIYIYLESNDSKHPLWVYGFWVSLGLLSYMNNPKIVSILFILTLFSTAAFSLLISDIKPRFPFYWIAVPGTKWFYFFALVLQMGIPFVGIGSFVWHLNLSRLGILWLFGLPLLFLWFDLLSRLFEPPQKITYPLSSLQNNLLSGELALVLGMVLLLFSYGPWLLETLWR